MKARLARAWDSDLAHGFRTSPIAVLSALVLLILIVAAAFAPFLAPHNPMDVASLSLLDSFKPPIGMEDADWSNPLGTDNQGRDVLSAIMYGMRISLEVGISSVIVAIVVGIAIGLLAGYGGGSIDTVLMRVADVQLTFPAILTALLVDGVITAVLPRTMREALQIYVIIFAIGISLWPNFARTVRGSTLVERNKDYVLAARVIGVPPWRIMLRSRAAQRHRAGDGDRNAGPGQRRHNRGDAVVPGRRPATDATVAGHVDPFRRRFPVLRPVVDHGVPRRGPGAVGAGDQPAG